MEKYILSIIGVVFVGIVIDLLVSKGKMTTIVKMVYSLFVVYTILYPIIFNLEKINITDSSLDYELDKDLLDYIFENKKNEIINKLCMVLEDNGITNVWIDIDLTDSEEFKIEYIYVNICDMVLNKNLNHIDINKYITDIIIKNIELKEGVIVVNE